MGYHVKYITDENGDAVECGDLDAWAKWFEDNAHRRVALDEIDGIKISTVFLGFDHAWDGGPPVLWETMIFGGEHDDYQERYMSRADALAGHQRAVDLVRKPTTPPDDAGGGG